MPSEKTRKPRALSSLRPRRRGPQLTARERAIPVATRSGNTAAIISALLVLITQVCTAMVAITVGTALGDHADAPFPWVRASIWALSAALSECVRIVVEQRSAIGQAHILHRRLMRHAFDLGPARLSRGRTGSLVTLMTQGTEKIAAYRQTYLGQMVGAIVAPIVILIVVGLIIDAPAALCLALAIPALPILLVLFGRDRKSVV